MPIHQRIASLRAQMKAKQLDAYIIPSNDPHQSEYVADHWKARAWISGFTGSAGVVIVTQDHAGLWTDSRYFLQAEEQLAGNELELHKQEIPHAPEHIGWLADKLPEGSVVGCDGNLFSVSTINYLAGRLNKKGIEINYRLDLIGSIWKDRPPIPRRSIFEHDIEFAGKSRNEKLEVIRKELITEKADYYLLNTLDDIAWCLNIRGEDVPCNPVAICYLLVGLEASYLFIYEEKVPSGIRSGLQKNNIQLMDYEALEDFLRQLPEEQRVMADIKSLSIRMYESLEKHQWIKSANIVQSNKAIKNEVEIRHIREVMRRDGVALLRLYRWLEEQWQTGGVTEDAVAAQLAAFREEQGKYFGESFDAIVGFKGNGAIVHYRPEPESSARIEGAGMLLIDSGGQYLDGTTDITRTTVFGQSSPEQNHNYTLVLKGHIALATMQFPAGASGGQLDTLARMYLWREGLNYGHGTGHGVGFFLNVHEPPQGFAASTVTSRGTTAFRPGMLTSNEPGFYKAGEYGIRIENLVLCVEGQETDFGKFLKFETLTLFPIATDLIEIKLLNEQEKAWLNDYHRQVFEELQPLLKAEEVKWLEKKCRPLG